MRPDRPARAARVMYLTMNPNRASTTVATEGWFRLLPSRGLEPVLVSRTVGAFHEWTESQRIPAYHVNMPIASEMSAGRLVPALWSLWRLARRHQIDLVHCNEQDIYPVGQRLARLCGIPLAVSVHCTMDRGFCSWAFGGRRQPDRMYFVSEGNQRACRPAVEGIVPESRWRVLDNAIDLDHFRPDPDRRQAFREKYGLTSSAVIGVACALRAWKQLEHLFDAAARLTTPSLRVVVAGGPYTGEEAYAADLVRMARERLGNRFVPLGHLAELRDFYNGLDVFVNTSREEAGSISVIEALACGCPVVGYPSGSVDGQVLPAGGEMVAQGNVAELAAVLDRWLADRDRLQGRREGARRTAEERFEIRQASARLWEDYGDVLRTRRQSGHSVRPADG